MDAASREIMLTMPDVFLGASRAEVRRALRRLSESGAYPGRSLVWDALKRLSELPPEPGDPPAPAAAARLLFARWLVDTGRLTDEER